MDSPHVSVWAVVLAVVFTVGAGVIVSYGLARDDTVWLLLGAALFAPVVVASTHGAARAVQENRRSAGAAACAGLAILFIVVIVITEPWWGDTPALRGKPLFLASSDPTAHVYLRRTPAGAELTRRDDPKPLVAAKAYRFACQVELSDGTIWLQLSETSYWAPENALLTKQGTSPPRLPTC